MTTPQHTKRCAIVGTAPSWKQTPWDDPTLMIMGINDGYALGFPRADVWFEQHPLDHLYLRPLAQKQVFAEQIPYGYYVRPEGHLDWLKQQSQTIPIYLQANPPKGFGPRAKRYPLEDVEAAFGKWEQPYWASGPAYMLMLAILQGYTEIHVYGIHLSTEEEYRQQRPNWEFLLGRFLGRHVTQTTKGQTRIYDGDGVRLVLPTACPILAHGWQYAYQPKPPAHPIKLELQKVQAQKQHVAQQLMTWPRWKSKAAPMDRLTRLTSLEEDLTMRLHMQAAAGTTVTAHVR